MMDFDNVLSIATQNKGGSNVQKRYSLQTGPPKKDPKSKGVNPAAIQALLKKQQTDSKKKEIEMRKQKEELLAKRVELKSDRKARAMASRTKDNFRGYNGVPVVETPKKRRTKQEMEQERNNDSHSDNFRNNVIDPEDDEDNYEYEQTDSEGEPEPPRNTFNNSSSKSSVKPSSAPKSAPFNFADLLKLAEKKQHEPVELKPKIVKKEERLRTADEIRELELERKAKKLDKCVKGERNLKDGMSHSSSSSSKATLEKNKLQKPRISGSTDKQLPRQEKNNKVNSSSKSSVNDRDKLNLSHKEKDRIKPGSSSSSSNKMSSRPSNSEVSTKQMGTKLSSSHKSSASNNLSAKKDNSLLHKGRSEASPGNRPSSSALSSQKNQPQKKELQRPGVNANVKSNVTPKPGLSSSSKLGHPQARPGGPPQMKSGVRPGASAGRPQTVGQSRPGNGPTPGRPSGSVGGGAGAPRCTVVSETISSKNVAGGKSGPPPRPGMGQQQRPGMGQQQRPGMGQQQRPGMGQQQRPGMGQQQRPGMGQQQRPGMGQQRPGMPQQRPGMGQQQRPGMGQQRPGMPQQRPGMGQQRPGMMQQRPGMPPRPMNRPPGPMLPPITSAYKRKFEDEEDEYDSEMDDFIDDGDDDPEDISQHIKQIFGYDRNKFKDESDYALRFMESSWKDMQKEEARSLRMAVQEDLEEEKKEEEEMKRKMAKKPRKK